MVLTNDGFCLLDRLLATSSCMSEPYGIYLFLKFISHLLNSRHCVKSYIALIPLENAIRYYPPYTVEETRPREVKKIAPSHTARNW